MKLKSADILKNKLKAKNVRQSRQLIQIISNDQF